MASIEQQLAEAIKAQNELTQAVAGYKSQLDRTVAAQKAEYDRMVAAQKTAYDAWRASARDDYLVMRRHALNTAVIDKSFFKLDNPGNLDDADKSMTKWVNIGVGQVYAPEGCLVNVDTATCAYSFPGHYETPVAYTTDKSASFWQFVLANMDARSEQINERIKTTGLNIRTHGAWSDDAQMLRTTCVQIPGLHPYSRLFVRMVNRVRSAGYAPQDISKFGGSSTLRARFAEIYPTIRY